MIRSRVAASEPKGIRSSSWKVMPQAPRSASFSTASIGSRAVREASPNWSRPCQPTVHRPKEKWSAREGVGVMADILVAVWAVAGVLGGSATYLSVR